MNQSKIWLSNADNVVDLPEAQVIGISATTLGDRSHGDATIGFLIRDKNAMGAEPFDSVSAWLAEGAMVCLQVDDLKLVEGCKVRECRLDISDRTLYIGLFVPFPAQQVRHWFPNS